MFIAFMSADNRPLRLNMDRVSTYGIDTNGRLFVHIDDDAVYVKSSIAEIDGALRSGNAFYNTEAWNTYDAEFLIGDIVRCKAFIPEKTRGDVIHVTADKKTVHVRWENGAVTTEATKALDRIKRVYS